MKEISVVIPRYNEKENVGPMTKTFVGLFRHELAVYDCEFTFIDNDSRDRTREYLRALCTENRKIKAIFNTKNFGQFNSSCYRISQLISGATVLMVMDSRDPPKMIVKYVAVWEEGYEIAIGIKTHSAENPPMYHLHLLHYKQIRKPSEMGQIKHFTGLGLCDRSFIQVSWDPDDPTPFLRSITAEFSYRRKEIPYDQLERRVGKTNNNLYKLYDAAMLSVTSYTKFGPHLVTFLDGVTLVVSIVIALIYLMMRLPYWDRFQTGPVPLLIGMLFLGAMQIFFIGIVGKHVLTINQRIMRHPLVVEVGRLNFGSEDVGGTR